MKPSLKLFYRLLLVVCVALSALLLIRLVVDPTARMDFVPYNEPVTFVGEYTLDDATERQPWTQDTFIDSTQLHTLHLYGHFTREIAPGRHFILRVNNLYAQIVINERQVFEWGTLGAFPALSKSAGNAWGYFVTEAISPQDDVEIVLANQYRNSAATLFHDFFDYMCTGSFLENAASVLARHSGEIGLYVAILLLDLVILTLLLIFYIIKFPVEERFLSFAGFVIASVIWLSTDFQFITFLIPNPLLCETIAMVAFYLGQVYLLRYFYATLTPATRRLLPPFMVLVLLVLLVSLALQLTGTLNMYPLLSAGMVVILAEVVVLIGCLVYESIALRGEKRYLKLLPYMALCFSMLGDAIRYYLNISSLSTLAYYWGFLFIVCYHLFELIGIFRDSVEKLRHIDALERQLTQSKISVMLSQIKPHFLFNTLNTISGLCLTDPLKADEAIIALSSYLRGNIQSLEMQQPVPFEHELRHIKNYVNIEKMRFGDRLNVVYDIGFADFVVPTLSLQTLVENAIRHGLVKRREGGTVTLRTRQEGPRAVIDIIDDGVGFDTSFPPESSSGIGLANARSRLAYAVNADLKIVSTPGVGTTVTIRIPLS